MVELTEAARRSPVFADLDGVELQDVAAITQTVDVPEGRVVFSEGDAPDGLYVIGSGRVRISKGGNGRVLATLEEGDTFGEMALVMEGVRTASATAATRCRLHRIDRDAFTELFESRDPVAYKMLRAIARILCGRIGRIDDELAALQGRTDETLRISADEMAKIRRRLFQSRA